MQINTPDLSPFITTNEGRRIYTTTLELGTWNMNTTLQKIIATGIPNSAIIISISVFVTDDINIGVGVYGINFESGNSTTGLLQGSILQCAEGGLLLERLTGGTFDSVGYSSVAANRGVATITYSL